MMGMPTRMWRLLGLLDVAVLRDAVAEAVAAAVAGEAVLHPGAAEPGGGDGQHLLADDVVLAPAFVREGQINAQPRPPPQRWSRGPKQSSRWASPAMVTVPVTVPACSMWRGAWSAVVPGG